MQAVSLVLEGFCPLDPNKPHALVNGRCPSGVQFTVDTEGPNDDPRIAMRMLSRHGREYGGITIRVSDLARFAKLMGGVERPDAL